VGAYRNDHDALKAQVETLRADLSQAEKDTEAHEKIRAELEATVEELEKIGLTEVKREVAVTGLRRQFIVAGVLTGVAIAAIGYQASTLIIEEPHRAERKHAVATISRDWFSEIRPRCNPVEVGVAVTNNPAPDTPSGQAGLAACYALASRIDDARNTINALPEAQRARAAGRVFDIVHPIADSGDDVAAGPVMGSSSSSSRIASWRSITLASALTKPSAPLMRGVGSSDSSSSTR
jgi:hypothetical protein